MRSWRFGARARFFATLAATSLVPVIALAAVLAQQYRHELSDRGVAQAQEQAALISRLITDTQLQRENLLSGINLDERRGLDRLTGSAIDSGQITWFRLRSPDLRVVYLANRAGSPLDRAGNDQPGRTDLIAALAGESAARLAGQGDQQVVEVFAPLRAKGTQNVIGVLQIELPYPPIAAAMAPALHRLYLNLALGLLALYLVLAALVWWATRKLAHSAAQFEHQALHDALTDLPNQALFSDRINQLAAGLQRGGGGRRSSSGAAVVLIDIDGFRKISGAVGPANGDLLLTTVADRLRASMRAVDTVAALGGDRFGLILPGVERLDQMEAAAERIRAAVESEVILDGLPMRAVARIGVAFMPNDGTRPDVLIQHADVAINVAKRTHGQLICYDGAQNDYSPERLALISQLRRAVDLGELVLHFQPKVTQPDGRVDCLEALVRWQHPSRGLLLPDEFVPLAEQTGLIDDLTRWVLTSALTHLQEWRVTRPELRIAVNVSASTLHRLDLPQMIFDALTETRSEPGDLVLEVAETALAIDPERAALILWHLSGAGLRLGLDDFGQGYTSLGQLTDLPLNELKIDTNFVMNMLDTPEDEAIMRSLIELGHNLGLRVVAEGVETAETLEALVELGGDIAQGYFFSPPLPADQVLDWLDAHAPLPVT